MRFISSCCVFSSSVDIELSFCIRSYMLCACRCWSYAAMNFLRSWTILLFRSLAFGLSMADTVSLRMALMLMSANIPRWSLLNSPVPKGGLPVRFVWECTNGVANM